MQPPRHPWKRGTRTNSWWGGGSLYSDSLTPSLTDSARGSVSPSTSTLNNTPRVSPAADIVQRSMSVIILSGHFSVSSLLGLFAASCASSIRWFGQGQIQRNTRGLPAELTDVGTEECMDGTAPQKYRRRFFHDVEHIEPNSRYMRVQPLEAIGGTKTRRRPFHCE